MGCADEREFNLISPPSVCYCWLVCCPFVDKQYRLFMGNFYLHSECQGECALSTLVASMRTVGASAGTHAAKCIQSVGVLLLLLFGLQARSVAFLAVCLTLVSWHTAPLILA